MVSSCILPFLLLSLSCFGKGMILTPAAAQIPRFENGLRTRHSLSNWVRTFNYSDALSKSILFYEGQRSGKLPANQRLRWREDSALTDGSSANVDLVGGYYDAGDNVKFGFPMAFTGTMLSWSVLEFGRFMATDISNALSAIRWVSDYLLKATAHRDLLYVQVGDPNSDHRCWERPEDMDTPGTVFTVNTTHPGSDVAAETAAALAAASIVFRSRDRAYSSMLLSRAIQVYEFADKYRGSYSDVLKSAVCPFYCSYSGYTDELLWGAAWLHKATGNPSYLEKIELNAQDEDTVKIFSWDNKHVGAQVLLSKAFLLNKTVGLQKFKTKADDYICAFIPGNPLFSMQYTPGGLLYFESESNLQYVTAASFLMLTYAKYLKESEETVSCGGTEISAQRIRMVAKSQVDYILGKNPQVISYMVAFGGRFPQMIHHRASSLPSKAAHEKPFGCKEGFFALYSPKTNPNLLVGAVVGGPDENDRFWGLRTDYIHTEPATYINAPLLGSLAYLAHSTSL